MVKKTVKIGKLFGWTRNFEVVEDEEKPIRLVLQVGNREYHVMPTIDTMKKLKAISKKFRDAMNEDIEIEGTVLEIWEIQTVTETKTFDKYVRVQ